MDVEGKALRFRGPLWRETIRRGDEIIGSGRQRIGVSSLGSVVIPGHRVRHAGARASYPSSVSSTEWTLGFLRTP